MKSTAEEWWVTPLMVLIGVVIAALGIVAGVGALATRFACGAWSASVALDAGVRALAGNTSQLATASGCVPDVGLVRGLAIGAVVLILAAAVTGFVLWSRYKQSDAYFVRDIKTRAGFANRAEIAKYLSGKALVKRAPTLRPNLTGEAKPEHVGTKVGRSRGLDVFVSIEDSVVIEGPPRQGKGFRLLISAILDRSGPLITTSTRNDNLAATMTMRAKRGEVTVFDPQGLSGVRSSLRISPIVGCEDPLTSEQRAAAIIAGSGLGKSSSNQEWADASKRLSARLFHAAAIGGRGVSTLALWGTNPRLALQAVDILRQDGPPGWAEDLESTIEGDSKMLESKWFGVSGALSPLMIPQIAEMMNPAQGEAFEPAEFLTGENTLYLIGTGRGAGAVGGFLGALLDDVVEVARRRALTMKDSRLDPPLGLILDEIANMFAWPQLPTVMADGGGIGISAWVIFQAKMQAETAWSRAEMQAVWGAATAKILLGGASDVGNLKEVEDLLGKRHVQRSSKTYNTSGNSESVNKELVPLMSVDEIRRMPESMGLLTYRNRRGVILDLEGWIDRADADDVRAGKDATQADQQVVFAEQAAIADERRARFRNGAADE